jgi:LacI family transcriptional regulator, sucrose operon repressor
MASIKDVAKYSNVSITTVSRVLNNRGYISKETKEKVVNAMEVLDYVPNEIARSLFRKKSNILGIIIPSIAHPFFGELVKHIEFYAYKSNYKLLLCNSLSQKEKEKEYIEMLKANQVDGIIMGSHTTQINEYIDLKLPIVSVDRKMSNDIPCVCSDNYAGGVIATRHLLEQGCKHILHFSGSLKTNMLANQRTEAFIFECENKNIEYRCFEMEEVLFGDLMHHKQMYEIIKENRNADGIFTTSDVMAATANQICAELGIQIPNKMKIVGYDDSMVASLTFPTITTVRQPIELISKNIVKCLTMQIDGEFVEHTAILPVELIVRGTSMCFER